MSYENSKILVVGPSWVGDMVMAQSLFIDIKRRYPSAQLDVLAPAWTAAIVDRMPQISELVAADFQHGKLGLGERWRLAKQLKPRHYDQAILLPNSLKSALVPAMARIPKRTGFVGEQRWGLVNDIRKLNKVALPMTVQRFIALGEDRDTAPRPIEKVPPPQLLADKAAALALAQRFSIDPNQAVLALCPGAEFGVSKQWPSNYYAELAKVYINKGWQVVLLGSDKDQAVCGEIASTVKSPLLFSLAGKTRLPEAVDLLSLAALVVANDSGLMHIAAALQKPLVAVYGSTDPGHTPPLSPNHKIARLDLDCSPCFERDCPLAHHNCMRELSVEAVAQLCELV